MTYDKMNASNTAIPINQKKRTAIPWAMTRPILATNATAPFNPQINFAGTMELPVPPVQNVGPPSRNLKGLSEFKDTSPASFALLEKAVKQDLLNVMRKAFRNLYVQYPLCPKSIFLQMEL